VDSFTLYPRYQLERRPVGPQIRPECFGKEKNLLLPGIKPGPSNAQPVAIRTCNIIIIIIIIIIKIENKVVLMLK
jgi:hypothetical protein